MQQFTIIKRGYDPEEVDKYISTLESVVKSYKEKDNAIKNAIISAQVAADNMIKNARAQADEYKGLLSKELVKVKAELDSQRARFRAFQETYDTLVSKHLRAFDATEVDGVYHRLDDIERLLDSFMSSDITPGADAPLMPSEPVSQPTPPTPSAEDDDDVEEIYPFIPQPVPVEGGTPASPSA
jgi:cell division septum initiation protein DivIVA